MTSSLLRSTLTAIVCFHMLMSYKSHGAPLDDYVNKPDNHYKYEHVSTIKKEKYTIHVLNMTSQKWLDEKYTNRPIWWHYVSIVVPKELKFKDTAFLFIGQDHNSNKSTDLTDIWLDMVVLISISTKTVGALVSQVPNEPIVFKSDPMKYKRTEDKIVAWSWREFLQNTSQPENTVLLPMTKAAVRAMDTVDDYSKKTRNQTINKFFVSGASKRGWTTWLTAAVDKRVIGMAPIVFDLLNFHKALHHHYRSLGGWTFAFRDYLEANDTLKMDSKSFKKTIETMDPFAYKDRYKMPTFILKGAGDEFFLLDETRFFYSQIPDPTFMRVLPNCEHTMLNQVTNVMLSLRSFFLHLLHGATYPKVKWTMSTTNSSGTIHVSMDREPLTVIGYKANTLDGKRRDFRLLAKDPHGDDAMLHPVFWIKTHVTKMNATEYKATVEKPTKGWTAFFIEMTFKGVEDSVLAFSTEVNVVPDTLPFPDCVYTACKGHLI